MATVAAATAWRQASHRCQDQGRINGTAGFPSGIEAKPKAYLPACGRLKKQGCEFFMGSSSNFTSMPLCMICGTATGILARFWFVRESRKSDFSERDRSLLGLLQGHFSTALRLARTILEGDIYRASWQQTTMPRFVLDASGKITDMNAVGTILAGDGDVEEHLAQVEAIGRDMIAGHLHLQNAEFAGQKCRVWLSEVVLPNSPMTYILALDTARDVRNLMRQCMADAGCSEREVEVCMMMAQGATNRVIADKLFIAEATVKDHVTSILEKLGVTNRSAVVPKLLGI